MEIGGKAVGSDSFFYVKIISNAKKILNSKNTASMLEFCKDGALMLFLATNIMQGLGLIAPPEFDSYLSLDGSQKRHSAQGCDDF